MIYIKDVTKMGPCNAITYNCDIEHNVSIRLHGTHQGTPFDVTFKMGDLAEYDSYNLHYLGEILKITPNTVTISQKATGESKNKRLSLYEFCWRNYNFDLKKIDKKNMDTMQYI